jgi:dipeptidyl aminopeptidase/acylaminoacyl peptidase
MDKKLLYSPVQYFEKVQQPILIVQGTMDEIIPPNSHEIISNALKNANNTDYETILLEGASHSMYYVGESDFPYWSRLHPDYLTTIEDWMNSVSNQK